MFSIIIPTILRRPDILSSNLDILVEDEIIDEIFIINNNPKKDFEYSNPKIQILKQKENLYVNKSWNLGIQSIKNEYFGLLNDDIVCCKDFISKIYNSKILEEKNTGLVGMNTLYLMDLGIEEDEISPPEIDKDKKPQFMKIDDFDTLLDWGCIILGKKENYYYIPESLKILYGDNYLLYKNKAKNNYSIIDLPVKHIHSLTVRSKAFEQVVVKDMILWPQILTDIS